MIGAMNVRTRRTRLIPLLAVLALALPGANGGRAADDPSSAPEFGSAVPPGPPGIVSAPPQAPRFVVAGWATPDDWRFLLGPTDDPSTSVVQLLRRVPGGGLGIACRRSTGAGEVYFVLDGLSAPPGSRLEGTLRVGGAEGPVAVVAGDPPSGERDAPLAVQGRQAATDVLWAMAAAGPDAPVVLELPPVRRSLTLLSPSDPALADVAARVCDGWASAAANASPPPQR